MQSTEQSSLLSGSYQSKTLENEKKLISYQKLVYILTFIAYAMSHFCRKAYTTVKSQMKTEAGFSPSLLSRMDTGFMFAYAIGSFFSGTLGDRFSPTLVVSLGLIGSAACVMGLIFGLWIDLLKDEFYLANAFFLLVWICHGLFQSTGGPVNTAIMGNWFDARNRGLIFGTWTCHQYIGNIIAAACTTIVLQIGMKYWWALVIAALSNLLWGCFLYVSLPSKPADVGMQSLNMPRVVSGEIIDQNAEELPPIHFLEAFKIPAVAVYAVAFGFFKLVNYVIFFWLPFFLGQIFQPSMSIIISALYDVGMMPGGIIVGYVSDLYGGRRACVIVSFLLMLCPLFFLFGKYSDMMPVWLLLILLGIMGILVGGPNNIISSAVAADLAGHPSIHGNSKALGTVTGIINGSGSITAAIGLLFIGPLQTALGWAAVWYLLILSTLLGCSLLLPTVCKELFRHQPLPQPIQTLLRISYDSFDVAGGMTVIDSQESIDAFSNIVRRKM